MDGTVTLLLGVVVVIVFGAIMVSIATKSKSGKGGKQKGRATIIRDATRKLSQDPHSPDGLIPLGELYFSEHSWEKAYPIYDTMHNIFPAHKQIDPFLASQRLGICGFKLNKPQDALRGLKDALKLRPNDFESNYYTGLTFYSMGEFERAVPNLKKALIINPEAPKAYGPLGLSLYKGKHYRESLPYLKRALDEKPDDKEALFSMADAMQESGLGEKAMKVFMHLRPDPEFGARSCLIAGTMHEKSGQFEKAIQDFEIGLKHANIPPETALELRYKMANSSFALKNISKGIQCLYEIQSTSPNYRDVPQLIQRYSELNQNKNLQIYLMAGTSDFVALCRKIVMTYYSKSFVKIIDISVQPDCTEVLVQVESSKWEDTELFRFYRSTGVTGELYVRDFHAKLGDSKADRGFCVTSGHFSEEGRKYSEGRPFDLIEKEVLVKILKKVDMSS